MTKHEILQKVEAYKTSNAPVAQKQAAIDKLLARLITAEDIAKQQYMEGLADISDMCNLDEKWENK